MRASRIADRHLGIGCDQILVLRDARRAGCRLRYEIWNADGSPAGQCGNGARCVGLYLELSGETDAGPFTLESPAGPVTLTRCADGEYEVAMGEPDFRPEAVPLSLPMTLPAREGRYRLDSPWGPLELGAVSMGNPHALVLVDDIGDPRIPEMGAWIGTHAAFPEGCNAGFAQVLGPAARAAGFWQHQCRGNGHVVYGMAEIENFLKIIDFMSAVFGEVRDISSAAQAFDALFMKGNGGSAAEQFDRELLVTWFNFACGAFDLQMQLDTDHNGRGDTSFADVVNAAEMVRLDAQATAKALRQQAQILHDIEEMASELPNDAPLVGSQ